MLVLDAGAFLAVERGDRDVAALVKRERLAGRSPVTSGGVVAQVWRGGRGRQAEVGRLLAGVEVAAIDDALGRRAGALLARSGQSDAIDAAIVCLAADGDDILTSDPGDLRALAEAAEIHVELIPRLIQRARRPGCGPRANPKLRGPAGSVRVAARMLRNGNPRAAIDAGMAYVPEDRTGSGRGWCLHCLSPTT